LGERVTPTELAADPDGNTYVVGVRYQERGWLRKLDANGDELWSRTLPGIGTVPTAIGVDPSSGDVVIAFGEDGPAGTTLLRVRKYDPEGSELWTATESGTDVSAVIQRIYSEELRTLVDGDLLNDAVEAESSRTAACARDGVRGSIS
jgi:outer membrane protein assembly factor BamB